MLSRRHIRAKVLQSLYSYFSSNDGVTKDQVEKQLLSNLNKLYELYLYLLIFLEELAHFAQIYDAEIKARDIPSAQTIQANEHLYNNFILKTLSESEEYHNELKKAKLSWSGEQDLVRKVFLDLKNKEYYKDWIIQEKTELYEDVEVIKNILKYYPLDFSLLAQHLEDQYINWHDDKKIAVQMAARTIRDIAENPDNPNFLQPKHLNKEENLQFAIDLYNGCIEKNEELMEIILSKISKWEPKQVSKIDYILLRMGLYELLYFPSIPTRVTINEYIELSKSYSTPKSKNFINGVLDNLLKELKEKGKLYKEDKS